MTSRSKGAVARGACLGLLSLLLVATIWAVPYVPTNDGPESVFAAHMENHYADPATVYREFFAPTLQFAGLGFTVLFGPLEALFGWQRGLQVALSAVVLGYAWGVVALVRAVSPSRASLAFVGFPLALSWPLYMGFFAFSVGSGMALYLIALGLRWKEPTAMQRGTLGFLLLVVGFAHIFAAILAGAVLAAVSVSRAPSGRRLVECGKLVVVGLPVTALVALAFVTARDAATGVAGSESFVFRALEETLATWPRTLAPGPLARALVVTACTVAAACYASLRVVRREAPASERGLALAGVLFLAASLAAPMHVPGWQCFSQRFALLGVALLLPVLPVERLAPGRRQLASVALALGSAAWLASSFPFHRRLASSVADAIAALEAPVRRSRLILPVSLEPAGPLPLDPGQSEVPYLAPLSHIGALFATTGGGLSAYTFASNAATWPFVYRADASPLPPIPSIRRYFAPMALPEFQTDRSLRLGIQDDLATYGMAFEGVVVTAARADDLAHWSDRGYVTDWARGSVLLAHFEPCTVEVTVPENLPLPRLDVGVGAATVLKELRPGVSRASGLAHLVVHGSPCGSVWVRPHWTVDASTTTCANASPTGELALHASRPRSVVACTGMKPPSAP